MVATLEELRERCYVTSPLMLACSFRYPKNCVILSGCRRDHAQTRMDDGSAAAARDGALQRLGKRSRRRATDPMAERPVQDQLGWIRGQLAKGVGILKVAKSLGIGTGTVQRVANEFR
jgi:hypothetical protein